METTRIVSILETLAAGVDPGSGDRIPIDAFHTPDVIRALFLGASRLKEGPPPRAESLRPAAAGARWTDSEDFDVSREFDEGVPIREIAQRHGRTSGGITSRLVKLGKIDPSTVRVRDPQRAVVSDGPRGSLQDKRSKNIKSSVTTTTSTAAGRTKRSTEKDGLTG